MKEDAKPELADEVQEQINKIKAHLQHLPEQFARLRVLQEPANLKKAAEADVEQIKDLKRKLKAELKDVRKSSAAPKAKPKPKPKTPAAPEPDIPRRKAALAPREFRQSRFRGAQQQQPGTDADPMLPPAAKTRRREWPDVSEGTYPMPLPAVNEVDETDFPSIEWITESFPAGDVQLNFSTEFLDGCQCVGGCSLEDGCDCQRLHHDHQYAYLPDGQLTLKAFYAVYECNSKCQCGPNCFNRVVQHGPKYPLEVFKTRSKGWGVRAKSAIPKWHFVAEYVGEIITSQEAERRGAVYDRLKCSYLYDLDFFSKDEGDKADSCFTIDANNAGSVARFFNHSCDPNLINYQVFVNNRPDHRLPRICFFTLKDVKAGDELTFDYRCNPTDDEGTGKSIPCHCGAKKCKGKVF
eukprot:TRINITY_DN14499_c0_g1_i1.p1 TRINITY_DN14499_c0_g1~~TRINITY_DN14499_c0_g1_i1.p1  ORF type:complete len:409 (-),score=100.47 TRINITY_DN14499_c0_g1_i1:143-1369(-)